MSQYGMQMPGGRARQSANMDVYTGLLFLGVVSLAVAAGFMWKASTIVGPDGKSFELHPEKVAPNQTLKLAK